MKVLSSKKGACGGGALAATAFINMSLREREGAINMSDVGGGLQKRVISSRWRVEMSQSGGQVATGGVIRAACYVIKNALALRVPRAPLALATREGVLGDKQAVA
ncbi:unnamed protein product, partial [Iphiclides podalirius]